jgi:membrane fusion protein, copper/silver efflux system
MRRQAIRGFMDTKAKVIEEGRRQGFFALLRMTNKQLIMTCCIVTLSEAKGLIPPGKYRSHRNGLLYTVILAALFLICGLMPSSVLSQDHSAHQMQSMQAEKKTGEVKSKETPPVMEEEKAQEVPQVEIAPEQQKLIGVKTVKVSFSPFKKVIRTVGRVEADERRLATVNSKIEGWIEKLYVNYSGAYVKEGEPLAEIYSPELLATQLEFINALKWSRRKFGATYTGHEGHEQSASNGEPVSDLQKMLNEDAAEALEAARQRLRLWDVSEAQLAQIEENGKPIRTVTLYSPVSGFITEKMALLGMKVMPGEKLFDVADLSNLWVIADIYEYELPFIRLGQSAKITMSYIPGKEISSKIDYIYPSISGETRTAKVRFSLSNPNGQLKPQMYTNVEIAIDMGKRLIVPESALIDTGEKQVVYVDLGTGAFEPREVKLGLRADGYAEVVKGLKEGEIVSTAANFLIDSEAQLRGVTPLSSK